MGDARAAVPMAVFLADAVAALMVVAVFHAPIPAHRTTEALRMGWGQAGDEVPDVNARLAFPLCFGSRFATGFHPKVRLVGAREKAVGLIDEPMAGVLPSLGGRLKELVRELAAKDGVTVALIEHDMAFVRDLADAVVVLRGRSDQ